MPSFVDFKKLRVFTFIFIRVFTFIRIFTFIYRIDLLGL